MTPPLAGLRRSYPQSTGLTTITIKLRYLEAKARKDILVKFRCERDSLVEVLTTAGRAVSSRTSTSMALGGVRIESRGQPPGCGRHRPRSHRARLDRSHRDHRRRVCGPGQAAGRHRPLPRARRGHHRIRGREGRDRCGPVTLQPADLPGRRLPVPARATTTGHVPARSQPGQCAAPGGAGGIQRRRPAPPDRGVDRRRRAEGIRLVATDSYRLAMRDIEGSDAFDRHLADSRAGPGAGRAAEAFRPRAPRRKRIGRRRRRTAPTRSDCPSESTT